MRKIFGTAVLTLIFIACFAQALAHEERISIQDIIDEANELNRWHKTYEAYGRTIVVDIPISIPQVDSIPIVTASTWTTDDSQVLKSLQRAEGIDLLDGEYAEIDKLMFGQLNNGKVTDRGATIQIAVQGMILRVMFNSPEELLSVNTKHYLKIRKKDYYPYQLDFEDVYAENNDMSLALANEYLERILAYYLAPETVEYSIDYVELADRARKTKSLEDEEFGECVDYYDKGSYFIRFFQNVHGIPVMLPAYYGYENLLENHVNYEQFVDWGVPGGIAQIMDTESFWVFIKWIKEERIEKEDLRLLPLESIIQSIEDQIYKGYIRNVYSLRLGYTIFLNDDSPNTYTLFPMWVLECDYVETPNKEVKVNPYTDEFREGFSFSRVLINPQTGKVSDRMHPTQRDMYCPEIIK